MGLMDSSFSKKIEQGINEPELIIPFFERKIKEKISAPYIKKILRNHEAEFITRGTNKEVYKIPFHFLDGSKKDYAVAFIRKPIRCEKNTEFCVEKMRNTRKWYENTFGEDFVNSEKLLQSQNNKDIIIYIQPWINFKEGKKNLFYDIPGNMDSILEEMKNNAFFKEQMKEISKKIITTYQETGFIPDLFNSMTQVIDYNPANLYLTEDNRIVFIDTHTISYDRRILKKDLEEKDMLVISLNERRSAYVDKLVSALGKARDFRE